ncbi:MAG: mycofactocin radical SAM maturase [Dehalococcoidales bacterium]|nr:mycofactocin radical SAM maturase [Dehalococcoidales bacterium]
MRYRDFPLSAPVNVTWEITRRCNLRCVHCLSASETEDPAELSLDECRRIVDELASLRVFEINFGGGEPLIKDYFLRLLRYIHDRGIVTCISTNGTVLTDEAVAAFSGNPLVNIQVSLDGASPGVNDSIRGRGTYERIIRGIERLARRNINLSINCVVTSRNYHELANLKELARAYGATLRISRFRPSGRARKTWEELRLSAQQLAELARWLESDPTILTGDSFFAIAPKARRELGLDMCGGSKLTACIDPVGNVYPCAFLQDEEFLGGNLREHSFKEIWDGSPVFNFLRRLEPSACRGCPRFEKCRGGCPAVAYFTNHDLDSADPECLMSFRR